MHYDLGAEFGLLVNSLLMPGVKLPEDTVHQPSAASNNANDYIKFTPEESISPVVVQQRDSPNQDMCALCQQVIGTARMILMRNESKVRRK